MSETWGESTGRIDRRGFLGAGAGAIAAAAALGDGPPAAAQDRAPRRPSPPSCPSGRWAGRASR